MMVLLSQERYTPLQKQELLAARNNDLSPQGLALLDDPRFNYRQMHIIRTLLEKQIAVELVRKIAKPWIKADEMEELIEAFLKGEDPPIPGRPLRWRPAAAGIAAILSAAVLSAAAFSRPKEFGFDLSSEQVRLSCGMEFQPQSYVKDAYGENTELIMPEAFTAKDPGTRLVVYEMRCGGASMRKMLRIEIYDETPPEIRLIQNHAELLRVTKFSCLAYLDQAIDNVDGDLSGQVECSDALSEEETQKVLYTVKDRAGNTASAQLEIHFAKPPEETVNPPAPAAVTKWPARSAAPVRETPSTEPVESVESAAPEFIETYEIVEHTETQEASTDGTVVAHHI